MHRLAGIILAVCFLAIGSGVAEYAHNLQHEREDAVEAKATGQPVDQHHDETNCAVHAQLHLPFTAAGWVPLLVLLGLFVAFLTEIPAARVEKRAFLRIDCRGPPACC